MTAVDSFQCPHEGCNWWVDMYCVPHSESIGDTCEESGAHCWDVHRCLARHDEAWTHYAKQPVWS